MDTRDETTARGPMTLIRGWAMAIVATVPAAALHGGADGHTPSVTTLLIAIVLSAAVSVPLIGKKFTRVRSGAAILGSQALFHTFFSMAGTGNVTVSGATSGAHSHHAMTSSLDISVAGAGMTVSPWMIAAHVLAALITVGLVWYGEAVLRSILHAVGTAVSTVANLASVADATLALPNLGRIPVTRNMRLPIAARVTESIQGRAPPVCV